MPTIELWYIETTVNNHNSQLYIDIINDMRRTQNGVYNANVKLNNGFICDYVVVENESYVEPKLPKASKVVR